MENQGEEQKEQCKFTEFVQHACSYFVLYIVTKVDLNDSSAKKDEVSSCAC